MSQIIKSSGVIKHLNIRKDGPDDDKVLGLDVKLAECPCEPEFMASILGNEDWRQVVMSFWDLQGNPRFLALEPISSWATYNDCDVEIAGMNFTGCIVKKFKLTITSENNRPAPHVELSISIKDPQARQVAILAELVADSVVFCIERVQQELDLRGDLVEPERAADQPDFDPETGELFEPIANADDMDQLWENACDLVIREQRVSASFLQRCLRIGYNRASRLIANMELMGIVSPPDPQGGRSVLLQSGEAH